MNYSKKGQKEVRKEKDKKEKKKERKQGEKYRKVLSKLKERWREGQILMLSIDGIAREGFSVTTEWMKPRPKKYCSSYYHQYTSLP